MFSDEPLVCVAKYGKIYVFTDVFNHQMSS